MFDVMLRSRDEQLAEKKMESSATWKMNRFFVSDWNDQTFGQNDQTSGEIDLMQILLKSLFNSNSTSLPLGPDG